MRVSIVIPAYNEEEGIAATIASIPVAELEASGYEVETLVIDNASTDKTAEIARSCGARVVYESKKGYGNAYQCGINQATGDIVATGDADTTYPFDALPGILAKMSEEQLQFINTDRLSELRPGVMRPSHIFGNRVLSATMQILFRSPFTDSQSGMWIFERSIWPQLDVRHGGMPFSQEIKAEAHMKGFRCAEVPIAYRSRVGEVKLSVLDAWRTMRELFRKRMTVDRGRVRNVEKLQS